MIFVDANVPIYLVGDDHPNKARAQLLVERAAVAGDGLVTDAEVFQEILHRFAAIRRLDAILARLGARDAIHAAVMANCDIDRILSFDADFDVIPGVTRLS